MTSKPEQHEPELEPLPHELPPRARLEEVLGRDFARLLIDALTESQEGPPGSSA